MRVKITEISTGKSITINFMDLVNELEDEKLTPPTKLAKFKSLVKDSDGTIIELDGFNYEFTLEDLICFKRWFKIPFKKRG